MRTNAIARIIVASSLVMLGVACTKTDTVTGSGNIVERVIRTTGFDHIKAMTAFQVHVTLGGPESVTVRLDDNLVDLLDAGVADGTLHLGLEPNTSFRDVTLEADVVVSELSGIDVEGASSVRLTGRLAGDALELMASGAGTLDLLVDTRSIDLRLEGGSTATLRGIVSDLTVRGEGASHLNARGLTASTLDLDLAGACTAALEVTGSISARLSGASTLRYGGTPQFLRPDVSGASTITPL